MSKVLLAAGHGKTPAGGWDPGTTWGGMQEHSVNEKVLWAAHDHFLSVGFTDFEVEPGSTRNTDDRLDGNWVAFRDMVNTSTNVSLAVEIHHDIHQARRGEFCILPKKALYDNEAEWAAARAIGDSFVKYGLPRLQDYEDKRGLGLIRRPKFPTLIIECDRLGADNNPEMSGTALAAGILGFLGWAPPKPVQGPTEASPGILDENLPLVGGPLVTLDQAVTAYSLAKHATEYTQVDLRTILSAYEHTCAVGGLSFGVAIAQMAHETGWLSSWWCQRPRRNPAGIGVTGATSVEAPKAPSAYDDRDKKWHLGNSFPTWGPDAVDAHVGRLLAYALPVGKENQEQARLIAIAGRARAIPPHLRGVAPTLKGLGGSWAVPGLGYGAALAKRLQTIASK